MLRWVLRLEHGPKVVALRAINGSFAAAKPARLGAMAMALSVPALTRSAHASQGCLQNPSTFASLKQQRLKAAAHKALGNAHLSYHHNPTLEPRSAGSLYL